MKTLRFPTEAALRQAHPKAIPLKQFLSSEAARENTSLPAIYVRITRGGYKNLIKLRVNPRVVYVINQP